MKSPIQRAGLIAGAALSLVIGGVSIAQTAQPAPAAPAAMKRQHDPAEHAARLRTALQLAPAQEPALQAFIASMQQHHADRDRMRAEHEAMASLTTPQRLDRMTARQDEHQQRMAQHTEAVRRFYAALTPAQQKAFDALHHGMGGKHGGRPGGHGGGDGHQDHAPQG